MNSVTKAEQLKKELDDLRPIASEAEKRIMQKFRLDWNYHSNNLEGNSLTYGETKALILFGITAQGKPLKDHFEITGHDEAIKWIEEVVKDKIPLTEKFIRELHTLLLKESSYKEAKTTEGKPTRRKIEVGKYKTQPNHVLTVTGEIFYFASPEETPAKMQELLEWFRKEKGKTKIYPILLASLFNYRFIRIHPFDDGNGRVARILMNFILIQFGYPPVIIKTEDKENYYAVLRLADADDLEPFIEYIAQNLVHSLKIMIKGAKGEDIEEIDDLDKELALLEGRLKNRNEKIKIFKSKETIIENIKTSIMPLLEEFINISKKFDRFYVDTDFIYKIDYGYRNININGIPEFSDLKHFVDEIYKLKNECKGLQFQYQYKYFNRVDYENFNNSSYLYVYWGETKYKVKSDYSKQNTRTNEIIIYEKVYSHALDKDEIKTLVALKAKQHKSYIEKKLKTLK